MRSSRDRRSLRIAPKACNGIDQASALLCAAQFYKWKDWAQLDHPPAQLPATWCRRLREALDNGEQSRTPSNVNPIGKLIPAGQRNDTLYKMACGWRAGGDDAPTLLCRLKQLNDSRCQPPLPVEELEKITHSAAKHASSSEKLDLATIIADSVLADQFGNESHLKHDAKRFYRFAGTHWISSR